MFENDDAILIEDVSKRYRIGTAGQVFDTLFGELSNLITKPLKNLRNLRNLSRFSDKVEGQSEDIIWALKGVSLRIRRGEVLGVIGRNGSGKSTLLKILSRITYPSSGRALLRGRVSSLLEVGTGFHGDLTGRENVYLNGAILGMTRREIDSKYDEIVEFSGVSKFIETPVKRYSSGMSVRLAFAVAAHLEPEILLVDEVLAVGDAGFQEKCIGRMNEVASKGRTVLFVSHNMAAVSSLCQRVVWLEDGQVVAEGKTEEVIRVYLNSFAKKAGTAISARKDFAGEGALKTTEVEFLDGSGRKVTEATSGQRLIVRLHFRGVPGRSFPNCRIGVSVHKDGRCYFPLSTELVKRRRVNVKGAGHVDFILDRLPLSGGKYSLTTFIESNGVIQHWLEGAAQLSVEDGDYYGTGRSYPSPAWRGLTVLVPYECRLHCEYDESRVSSMCT